MINTSKKHILMLNSSKGFVGGVERMMVSIAQELTVQGWRVSGLFERTAFNDPLFDSFFADHCTAPQDDIAKLIDAYKASGVSIVLIHKCTYPMWVKEFNANFKTVVMVHDHDYYCLRHHKYFPIKRINCPLPFNPLYCTVCSMLLEKRSGRLARIKLLQRIELLHHLKACNAVFVLSEFMKRNLISNGFPEQRIKLLIPAQDTHTNPHPYVRNETPVILYMGQLIRGKGVDLLLTAFSSLQHPALLRIVGRGNDKAFLQSLCRKLSISNRVEFIEWTNAPDLEYQAADIVAIPSRWQEPFGLVGIEAFSHGKPVVAFNVGGTSQWLKHMNNGILVPAGDSHKLSAAIDILLASPDLRERYGNAGLELVKQVYHKEAFRISLKDPLEDLLGAACQA